MATAAFALPPTLYSRPAYQSPVQGQPDDLLMLGGYGFAPSDVVIYQALRDTQHLSAPVDVSETATAERGIAPVVSSNNAPYSLTIRLPETMRARQSYALWVRTASGELSNPIKINDLRPLWVSPAFVYATTGVAGLPRYLKLVGRNLDASPGHATRIKLTGPQTVELAAEHSGAILDSFVARVRLPRKLAPGRYRLAATRDGVSWIELRDQAVEVRPDPNPVPEFDVSDARFGGCRPDDGLDDTECIVKAIEAAKTAGKGTVTFGRGTWNLIDSALPGVMPGDGIVVPQEVSLRGMGREATRLARDSRWNAASPTATFTLRGATVVEGFTFIDTQVYVPTDRTGPFLQVGENSGRLWARTHTAPTVRDLIITHNRFDRTDTAIGDGGLAMERVFITYNEFGTYRYQLELGGNWSDLTHGFRIDDSVIDHNTFKPGSFLQVQNALGPIASEIGASHRLDFSDNIADGTATEFLYSPTDPSGWRAGFFFHMNNNQEMLLVSANTATCTGDKIGDGEAIALDNSGNTFAFLEMHPVVSADSSSVTVNGPLASRQVNLDIPLASYYVGHWVQVGDGPGVGQVRKITAYKIEPATGQVTFSVAPQWDVLPASGITRISVGREFWQAFIIGNHIDHRAPLCHKSNRSRSQGGSIALWAQLADSVIAGNEQYDTDGVVFHEAYLGPIPACSGCGSETFFQSFLDIRDNFIRGKYDTASDCKPSGITGGVSAAPGEAAPPTLGYGVAISHNRLERADNEVGGAIAVGQDWHDGPSPHRWPISANLIIQHNQISGTAPVADRACGGNQSRHGISFPGSPLTWKAVLYADSCNGGNSSFALGGTDIVRLCQNPAPNSCECPPSVVVQ